MAHELLTTFWVVSPSRRGPLGFGITAHSLDDALAILRAEGYGRFLPDDPGHLRVLEGVEFADLPDPYVRDHMGPIVVRGIWYPFRRLGTSA